jgi:hypothetical protein
MLQFLQTDRQTDGQAKNYKPPIFQYGGIKINFCTVSIHHSSYTYPERSNFCSVFDTRVILNGPDHHQQDAFVRHDVYEQVNVLPYKPISSSNVCVRLCVIEEFNDLDIHYSRTEIFFIVNHCAK